VARASDVAGAVVTPSSSPLFWLVGFFFQNAKLELKYMKVWWGAEIEMLNSEHS